MKPLGSRTWASTIAGEGDTRSPDGITDGGCPAKTRWRAGMFREILVRNRTLPHEAWRVANRDRWEMFERT
jgi:hypothetical protein